MKDVVLAFISLWKMTFQKWKYGLFSLLLIVYFYNYCLDITYDAKKELHIKLVQPQNGLLELLIVVSLFFVLVWIDFTLLNSRGKRAIEVIRDPTVSDEIKKILAEDYKNAR